MFAKTLARHYATTPKIVPHTLLFYKYVPDVLEKRAPHRMKHMEYAAKSKEEGKLIHGGALEPASDGAIIVFKGDIPEYVENFAKNDPYVVNKVVQSYKVQKWNTIDLEPSSHYKE